MRIRTPAALAALALATAIALPVFALAQQGPRDGDRPALPASVSSLQDRVLSTTIAIDGDNDGFVTVEEIRAHREAQRAQRAQARLLRLDTDGDGKVSVAEFEAPRLARIAALDADGDGEVSREEMRAARHERGGRRGGERGGRHGGMPSRGGAE